MILTVHVKSRSKKNNIRWIDKETAIISVTAIPEKGKANAAIIELLSKEINVSKFQIEIIRGKTTKIKQIQIK